MENYSHLPRYDDLFNSVLEHLSQHGQFQWRALERPIASALGLSDADLAIEYETGNGTVFLDRLSWAISHLVNTGLAERPKRGYCQISELGRTYVGKQDVIKAYVKRTMADRQRARQLERGEPQSESEIQQIVNSDTPQEQLQSAFKSLRDTVCEQILDAILSKSPYEFEKLVVTLLDRMGYGGKVVNATEVTKASNDCGIDGIIKEDVLGLGRIHLQAKRYKRDICIGREDIQKFVGALAVAQSKKGVFITTSYFTQNAKQYAQNLHGSTTIVLIDGEQLAQYIYDYGLGMQVEQQFIVKKMDADFWDEMLEDVGR